MDLLSFPVVLLGILKVKRFKRKRRLQIYVLIRYIAAGSTMSLLAGAIFGFLAAYGAYLDTKILALINSLLLLSVMGPRFYRGRKFMPAGLVTLLR